MLTKKFMKKNGKDLVAGAVLVIYGLLGAPLPHEVKESLKEVPGMVGIVAFLAIAFYFFSPVIGILAVLVVFYHLSTMTHKFESEIETEKALEKMSVGGDGEDVLEGIQNNASGDLENHNTGTTLEEEVIEKMAPLSKGDVSDTFQPDTSNVSPHMSSNIPSSNFDQESQSIYFEKK
tara:strand:- start:1675 stop:2205 length:531 start_codon:yes stop_codon:yes gene_type:complete